MSDDKHHVEMHVDGHGRGSFSLDGKPILARGVKISVDADKRTLVEFTIRAAVNVTADVDAKQIGANPDFSLVRSGF